MDTATARTALTSVRHAITLIAAAATKRGASMPAQSIQACRTIHGTSRNHHGGATRTIRLVLAVRVNSQATIQYA